MINQVKKYLITAVIAVMGMAFIAPLTAQAEPIIPGGPARLNSSWQIMIKQAGYAADVSEIPSLSRVVASIVFIFLAASGVIFVILFIYGGAIWLTALGNEERVKEAKTILFNAIIGIVIVFSAYSLTYFMVRELTNTMTAKSQPTSNKPLY